jgi:serine/threonine-protein kinase/endoribonuclease IRE1
MYVLDTALSLGRLIFWCSVAIFDVVKSARRTSPFVLLQPRLRLQDIIPFQREYPNDETAFVGLVPETGSLFALGPDNFPLVAFSGPVSAQKVEGIEGTSDGGVLISHEDSRLQCYEGTTDRRCQTGVRALRADSASRIARLLDGVPSPAAPPLPSATGNDGRPREYQLASISRERATRFRRRGRSSGSSPVAMDLHCPRIAGARTNPI